MGARWPAPEVLSPPILLIPPFAKSAKDGAETAGKNSCFYPRQPHGAPDRWSLARTKGQTSYLLSLPKLTRLTPSKVVFPALSGGVLLRAIIPVFLGATW
jgi:hypothetical protein